MCKSLSIETMSVISYRCWHIQHQIMAWLWKLDQVLFKVIEIGAVWSIIYDYLLVGHCKYSSILYYFWDKAIYWSKIGDYFIRPCIRRPSYGGLHRNTAIPPFDVSKLEWCGYPMDGRAPGYLADDFRLAGRGRPGSRSAASMMLDIPCTTTSLGESICRRRTACLEQPCSCHPWSVTVAVNLRKAAENLFVCLRVAALVTYELAPWKCTDWLTN